MHERARMFYQGGKKRIGASIAAELRTLERERFGDDAALPRPYVEPFCGMLGVAAHMAEPRRDLYLADAAPQVITLWTAWRDGWRPSRDKHVSRDEYDRLKRDQKRELNGDKGRDRAAWCACVGYACSHSGKWFNGYIDRDEHAKTPRYQQNLNSMHRQWATILENAGGSDARIRFSCADYEETIRRAPRRSLIYCDPPYAGTTGYRGGAFDHVRFWNVVRRASDDGHLVVVSEQSAPTLDFVSVWQRGVQRKMHISDAKGGKHKTEHLFVYAGGADYSSDDDDVSDRMSMSSSSSDESSCCDSI